MSGEIRAHGAYGTLQPPQPELPPGRRRGRSRACFNIPWVRAGPTRQPRFPLSRSCPQTSHTPKKWRSPENAVGLVHNSSHTGRCRRTTSPLLLRRDPKPTFPGRKAGMRTAFQCVFGQKINIRGIFFLFKAQVFESRDISALPYLVHDVSYCKQPRLGPNLNRSRL